MFVVNARVAGCVVSLLLAVCWGVSFTLFQLSCFLFSRIIISLFVFDSQVDPYFYSNGTELKRLSDIWRRNRDENKMYCKWDHVMHLETFLTCLWSEIMEKYVILGRIGEGAHGIVFKAKSIETGALVALKKVALRRLEDGIPNTALREIKALQEIAESPFIVHLREVRAFYSMTVGLNHSVFHFYCFIVLILIVFANSCHWLLVFC